MNLHTKLALTVSIYVAATAIMAPIAAASTSHTAPQSVTQTQTQSLAVLQDDVTPSYDPACLEQDQNFCADDSANYWAKDAYAIYAAPILSTVAPDDILQGFVSTYVGTYSTLPNWGTDYIYLTTPTAPNVWHAFLITHATTN